MWDEARYLCMMEDDPYLDMLQEEENMRMNEKDQKEKATDITAA